MSDQARRSYLFRTPAQWSACLFDRVDREAFEADGEVSPLAPYEQTARLYSSPGAHAPAVTRAGEILWHDDAGRVHQLTDCNDEPEVDLAPYAIAHASRIVPAGAGGSPVNHPTRSSRTTKTRFRGWRRSISDTRVIDIASDGKESLFVLVERRGVVQALQIDCSGGVDESVTFEGIEHARAFVYLPGSNRFVVSSETCPRL